MSYVTISATELYYCSHNSSVALHFVLSAFYIMSRQTFLLIIWQGVALETLSNETKAPFCFG
jgi:hypothetical protein